MKIELNGQVAIVTGASTGIGAAVAKGLAEAGAQVVVNYNNSKEKAEEVVSEIERKGGRAIAVQADVSRKEEVEALFAQTVDTYGKLNLLINNAGGLLKRTAIEEMEEELWDRVFEVNAKSVFLCSKQAIPLLKQQGGGKIINLSSQAARNGGGGGSIAYASSKGAVSTFTKGLAKELASANILVNGIAPGIIATPFHDRYTPEEMRAKMQMQIPLGREGTPEECVGAVLFLASEAADYMTGEMIEVNGGTLMD
ncbi:SDR family NAD(P)-dependent oxidoreductase [Halalkalibacter oceani]|uniref:3-oxoacyl-ACP reductase FabG n=1 Tax=Halalkalibacter oceani TaxID=1653776 RepID=A0A9X2IM37_9BACI|nr:3-oxoacyl-ACP reductase family protein [Halalkalibacter oceani]MCM3713494.1 3-oxoacyl-ACP reductase FabG [Halalkalibacter oceani]